MATELISLKGLPDKYVDMVKNYIEFLRHQAEKEKQKVYSEKERIDRSLILILSDIQTDHSRGITMKLSEHCSNLNPFLCKCLNLISGIHCQENTFCYG